MWPKMVIESWIFNEFQWVVLFFEQACGVQTWSLVAPIWIPHVTDEATEDDCVLHRTWTVFMSYRISCLDTIMAAIRKMWDQVQHQKTRINTMVPFGVPDGISWLGRNVHRVVLKSADFCRFIDLLSSLPDFNESFFLYGNSWISWNWKTNVWPFIFLHEYGISMLLNDTQKKLQTALVFWM